MTSAEILARLTRYHEDSTRRVHLIPSENSMPLAARAPFLTDALYRYSFPPDAGENWAWPGNEPLTEIEHELRRGLGELYGASHVNVKPISGVNCMTVMLAALAEAGGTVLSIAVADGGHGATRFIGERLGLRFVDLPYDPAAYAIDTDELARLAARSAPSLVYLDQFMCLFPHDLPRIRQAVGPDVTIHFDGSHVMGLIAGGRFQDPLREGADSLAGSMHKSFPGPHKGVILTSSSAVWERVALHSNSFVSHHHTADLVSLAVVVADLRRSARPYAEAVVRNAQALAAGLARRGVPVCAGHRGYTRSHQLWLDVQELMPPAEAGRLLIEADVVVNAIDVPYVRGGLGLRLGVQEVTRMGMREPEMARLAEILALVLVERRPPAAARPLVRELLADVRTPEQAEEAELVRRLLKWSCRTSETSGLSKERSRRP